MINKRSGDNVTTREGDRPFENLSPDAVLDAALSVGFETDGRLLALNSYENRVYQLGTDDGALVLKFYRASRWTDAQIHEEHAFTTELASAELPVAAPCEVAGETLFRFREFRFAVFPWMRGRAPELDAPDARVMLGRALARMHRIGAVTRFEHRERLTIQRFGTNARLQVLKSGMLPDWLETRYADAAAQLIERIQTEFDTVGPTSQIRIHGDCHMGNLLWTVNGPLFVDLDDCMAGPRMQDLWMLLSGDPAEQQRQWHELLEGYLQFNEIDFAEMRLIEPLRGLRMLHHAAWTAQRWTDPAFPRAFPWMGEARYWEGYVIDLLEQVNAIDDPPLLR